MNYASVKYFLLNNYRLNNHQGGEPLFNWVIRHTLPAPTGGLYLWPSNVESLVYPNVARILTNYCLFEFHVTERNTARILLRARCVEEGIHVAPQNIEDRWQQLRNLAALHGGIEMPVQGGNLITRSVRKWMDGPLQDIEYNMEPELVAERLLNFLNGESDHVQALKSLILNDDFQNLAS